MDPDEGQKIRLGWISSWNSRCGIAEHSRFLLDQFDPQRFDWTVIAARNEVLERPDDARTVRCWTDRHGDVTPVLRLLIERRFDVLVIQYNFSLLSPVHVEAILALCRVLGTRVFVIFHATDADDFATPTPQVFRLAQALSAIEKVFVHGAADLQRLTGLGVSGTIAVLPHGHADAAPIDMAAARARLGLADDLTVIGSYGFLLPPKGIEALIEGFALFKAARPAQPAKLLLVTALYPSPVSDETLARCRTVIVEQDVRDDVIVETAFLSNEESLWRLACCDVIVYPYQATRESSSAAVRMGIAARRPVLCTPLAIFADVAEAVRFLPGSAPADIRDGLLSALATSGDGPAIEEGQERWLADHRWPTIATDLQRILAQASQREAPMEDKAPVADYVAALVGEREALEHQLRDLQWLHARWQGLEADWWADKEDWRAQRVAWANEKAQLEAEIRRQADEQNRAIISLQAEQARRIEALRAELDRRTAELQAEQAQVRARLQAELDAVHASWSWWVTRPLRALRRMLRRRR